MGIFKKRFLDYLTGRWTYEGIPTDQNVLSGTTITAAATTSLVGITVPAGSELIIMEADVFSSSSASSFELTYTQVTLAGALTQTKYYDLSAAGSILDKGSVKQPIMVMINLTTANVTVNLNVISPTSGAKYTANVAYLLRDPAAP